MSRFQYFCGKINSSLIPPVTELSEVTLCVHELGSGFKDINKISKQQQKQNIKVQNNKILNISYSVDITNPQNGRKFLQIMQQIKNLDFVWAIIVAKQVNYSLQCWHSIRGTVSCPNCSTSYPAPCYWPWDSTKHGSDAWAPFTYVDDPNEGPGSWLWSCPTLTIVAICKGTSE